MRGARFFLVVCFSLFLFQFVNANPGGQSRVVVLPPGTAVRVEVISEPAGDVVQQYLFRVNGDFVIRSAGSEADLRAAPLSLSAIRPFLYESHREILRSSGWLRFVEDSIDRVVYRDVEDIPFGGVRATGLARLENGLRVAYVATRNRPDVEIARTIVHEAAHFSPPRTTGRMSGQDYAFEMEERFAQDYAAVSSSRR
jgi:hypothetical protein